MLTYPRATSCALTNNSQVVAATQIVPPVANAESARAPRTPAANAATATMSTFIEVKTTSAADVPAPAASGSGMLDAGAAAGSTAAVAAGALSHVAGLVPSVETLKNRVGDVWTRSRPWSEFANTSQMSKPEFSELLERVKENAEYYAFNYLVILLLMSGLTIITSPLAFLGGLFIVGAYFYLYFLNPEPIVALGITLDNNVKAAAIMLFSLVVLWLTGAGATFTGLLVVVGIIAVSHAALRKPPTEADFDTAYTGTPYTPATV
jgi:PRA1 family protein 1